MVIDKLAYWSRLRYKSPFLKAALSIGMLLLCVAASSFILSITILLIMGGLTVLSGKTPFPQYLRLMLVPITFIALSGVVLIVNITDVPMGLFSIGIFSKYISITVHSLVEGLRVTLMALGAISCLYFLTLTTPMMDILLVLQRLKCPKIIVELMMLTYRYIFVTLDMAGAILTAQKCRLGNKDFMTELRSIGQMLAVLLVRSLNRSALVFDAMEARCYEGDIRVLNEYTPGTGKEMLAVGSFLTAMLVLTVFVKINLPLW